MQVYLAQGLVDAVYALLTVSVFNRALRVDADIKPRWSRSTLTLIILSDLSESHGGQD